MYRLGLLLILLLSNTCFAELDWDIALEGLHRSEANKKRDVYRHPRETLEFFGLQEGQTVVELSPGGGWYSEILAPLTREGTFYAAHFNANTSSGYAKKSLGRYLQKLGSNMDIYGEVIVSELPFGDESEIAPEGSVDIVLGKFLGAFLFLALITLATAYMPALIFVHGKVSLGQILVGYTGLLSLGAATIAIGTFSSAIARNQLLAAVLGAGILVFILLGWMMGQVTEAPLNGIFSYTAIFDRHFQPFMKGRLNTEGLVYFASICFAFLLLAVRSLQLRRLR